MLVVRGQDTTVILFLSWFYKLNIHYYLFHEAQNKMKRASDKKYTSDQALT